jgi:hypothetical protein
LNRAKSFIRSPLGVLLVVVVLFTVALAGTQQPASMATCPDAAYVNYYSDATYTTIVGHCVHGCCQLWSCFGTLTNYSKIAYEFSCSTE